MVFRQPRAPQSPSPAWEVGPDISAASTPRGELYGDPALYQRQLELVFARSWQLLPARHDPGRDGYVLPVTLLPESLDEPLLLSRDEEGTLHCLSNACTHRGALVAERAGACPGLRCRYHGRRFGLDGRFRSMPGFETARSFPRPEDDLPRLPLHRWGPLLFTGLYPPCEFQRWLEPLRERLDFLPIDRMKLDPASSRDCDVPAHWALYCDNFLEGFHIPYVHPSLAGALHWEAYHTELFPWGSLQIGVAADGGDAFALPQGHPEAGREVAGFYFWLFPNLMVNAYPWGLSLNVVLPRGPRRCRVRFLSYAWDLARRGRGASADLHGVELEDEAVVNSVQQGVVSRLYGQGRYSPVHEQGVHHFHRLLGVALEGEGAGGGADR